MDDRLEQAKEDFRLKMHAARIEKRNKVIVECSAPLDLDPRLNPQIQLLERINRLLVAILETMP